jgi:hypothetical protein
MAMSEPDRDYYYQRAEAELALAQQSANQDVVKAHYELAGHYLDLVYGDAEQGSHADRQEELKAAFPDAAELMARLRAAGVILLGDLPPDVRD